jgi:hypothetical protein
MAATRELIAKILIEENMAFREETSQSWSDRHGPSSSVYFYVAGKTIRLSNHEYAGANLDVRYWDAADATELGVRETLGLRVPEDLRERVAAARAAGLARREAETADVLQKEADAKAAEKAVIQRRLEERGLGCLIGRQRRQAVADLHRKKR